MEEKTNYNGEYSSFDSDNRDSEMPDITGSSYSSDVLSSVSETTSNISSYNYGYSSASDVLSNAADEGLDTDSVLGTDSENDILSSSYSSFDTASKVSSSDIYKAETSVYSSSYSTETYDSISENNEQNYSEEATYDPTRSTYSYGTTGSTYQNSTASNYSYGSNVSSYSYGGDSSYDSNEKKGSQALGIVSMVFGILSLVCCCSGCVGMIMSVVAVVCGIIHLAKKGSGKGFGIAGIITGVLGLILGIVMFVFWMFGFEDLESEYSYDYDYSYDEDYDYDYSYDEDYDYDYSYDEDYYYSDEDVIVDYLDYIYGQWLIDSGSGTATYIINEDGTWGWYKDYNDLSNNYYAGSSMEVYSGQEAFDYYGMDASELDYMETDSDRFFCFKLYVDTYISGGEDKSSQYGEEDYFSIALYIDEYDTDSAILINMDSADQYNVTRMDSSASVSGDEELNFVEYSMYDGQASIYLPDSWIYYGQQITEDDYIYEAFGSESGMFELYVTIQELEGYYSNSQEMIEDCEAEMIDLFGSENIRGRQVLEEGDNTVILYEAYNNWDDFHYYRSYDIYDGVYYTTIEFYADEDTMNEGYDVYSAYLDDIYESFVINY